MFNRLRDRERIEERGSNASLSAVLLLVFFLTPPPASGASVAREGTEVRGLYRAEVLVSGKSADAREDAVRRALKRVIVKVTGRRNIAEVTGLQRAFTRPSSYLQQYRYGTVMQTDTTGEPRPVSVLVVTFDQQAINRLLKGLGLPIWSRVRPAVLTWIAVEANGLRTLIGTDDAVGLAAVAEETAGSRGLTLLMPLFDIEDRASLTVADVWGGFISEIERASERYGAEVILVSRVARRVSNWGFSGTSALESKPRSPTAAENANAQYESRWTLLIHSESQTWQSSGPTVNEIIQEGIQAAADRLSFHFAATSTGLTEVPLRVRNVESLEDYARTAAYLEGLDLVEGVAVSAADGTSVSYKLMVRGGRAALVQVLSLGRTLARDPGDGMSSTYRLVP